MQTTGNAAPVLKDKYLKPRRKRKKKKPRMRNAKT